MHLSNMRISLMKVKVVAELCTCQISSTTVRLIRSDCALSVSVVK